MNSIYFVVSFMSNLLSLSTFHEYFSCFVFRQIFQTGLIVQKECNCFQIWFYYKLMILFWKVSVSVKTIFYCTLLCNLDLLTNCKVTFPFPVDFNQPTTHVWLKEVIDGSPLKALVSLH